MLSNLDSFEHYENAYQIRTMGSLPFRDRELRIFRFESPYGDILRIYREIPTKQTETSYSGGKWVIKIPSDRQSLRWGRRNSLQSLQMVMVFSISRDRWTIEARILQVTMVYVMVFVSLCSLTMKVSVDHYVRLLNVELGWWCALRGLFNWATKHSTKWNFTESCWWRRSWVGKANVRGCF